MNCHCLHHPLCVSVPCTLSLPQTVFRIVVLGIWDYIENKVEVGAPRGEPLVLLLQAFPLQCHFLTVRLQRKQSCVFCQVFDGAVIVLSLAPMVASTVANGPSSPWDAIGLIITLRIWRVKRIIDGESGALGEEGGLMGVLSCQLAQMDTVTDSALHGILRLAPWLLKAFSSSVVQNLI